VTRAPTNSFQVTERRNDQTVREKEARVVGQGNFQLVHSLICPLTALFYLSLSLPPPLLCPTFLSPPSPHSSSSQTSTDALASKFSGNRQSRRTPAIASASVHVGAAPDSGSR
jgi:hypothetical protein